MTPQLTARHSQTDAGPMVALNGLPDPGELMTYQDIFSMARQLREIAIDAQREVFEPIGHDSEGGGHD